MTLVTADDTQYVIGATLTTRALNQRGINLICPVLNAVRNLSAAPVLPGSITQMKRFNDTTIGVLYQSSVSPLKYHLEAYEYNAGVPSIDYVGGTTFTGINIRAITDVDENQIVVMGTPAGPTQPFNMQVYEVDGMGGGPVQVGNSFQGTPGTIIGSGMQACKFASGRFVHFVSNTSSIQSFNWDGTDITTLGAPFAPTIIATGTLQTACVPMGTNRIAFVQQDVSNFPEDPYVYIEVLDFDSVTETWSSVAGPVAVYTRSLDYLQITACGVADNTILVADPGVATFNYYLFDGANWSGNGLFCSTGGVTNSNLQSIATTQENGSIFYFDDAVELGEYSIV